MTNVHSVSQVDEEVKDADAVFFHVNPLLHQGGRELFVKKTTDLWPFWGVWLNPTLCLVRGGRSFFTVGCARRCPVFIFVAVGKSGACLFLSLLSWFLCLYFVFCLGPCSCSCSCFCLCPFSFHLSCPCWMTSMRLAKAYCAP
ncbi:hypothetical protein DFS34DRAFT_227052 [Phlyctochytrium arcticum]|nr:hypothetical protein DFS34DRAFT_227052 [Phlyctochytrium arcticum]